MIALDLWAWDDPNYYEKHKVVPAIVQALVEAGANVNEVDPDTGFTPLMRAAALTDVATIECIIRHGAKVNAGSRTGGNVLWSVVMQPDDKDRSDVLQALLRHGANPNARLTDGSSVLSFVSGPGRFKYVRLLVKAGAKVNARDKHGWTVITLIKKSKASFFPGSEDVIPLLRKLGGHE
jgi:ankyrin repeat protein